MNEGPDIRISQTVAILVDGNNIEMSLTSLTGRKTAMLNFDTVIPKLLNGRSLSRMVYFREGKKISNKLAERLLQHYHGSVMPCYKSADIPLTIRATQIADKVERNWIRPASAPQGLQVELRVEQIPGGMLGPVVLDHRDGVAVLRRLLP